jgi:hypothetical protein
MSQNDLRLIWQESHHESVITGCGKGDVTMLLQHRSADLKRQILKRLATEINTYLLIGLFLLCALVLPGASTVRGFLLGAMVLLIIAPAPVVLAYKEYRLRTLPLSGSLRESVSSLIGAIDSTARLYLLAYLTTIAISLALIESFLVLGKGWSLLTIIFIPVALAFIAWSYSSGRRYAARMFSAYRSDLVNTLNDLHAS